MPQAFSPNPFMPLKVLDFCNLNQKVAPNFLQETAALTGIKSLLSSPLKTLSGGELQRVLLLFPAPFGPMIVRNSAC
jgi:ABC-type Mn2+/Zn2+ transport system ATPase subunit